jgi:hypothetical protein
VEKCHQERIKIISPEAVQKNKREEGKRKEKGKRREEEEKKRGAPVVVLECMDPCGAHIMQVITEQSIGRLLHVAPVNRHSDLLSILVVVELENLKF